MATAQEGSVQPAPPPQPEVQSNPATTTTNPASAETIPATPVRRKKKILLPPVPPPDTTVRTVIPAADNPFEIGTAVRQTSTTTIPTDSSSLAGRPVVAGSDNPFEISNASPSQSPLPTKPQTERASPVTTDKAPSNAFVFGVILGMLVLLSIAVSFNRFILRNLYMAFLNEASFRQALKDRASFGRAPFAMLYVFFLVNAGIFVYLLTMHWGVPGPKMPRLLWLEYCILGVSGIFLLKLAVIGFIGYVFPVSKECSSYQFLMTIFGIILGLLLVPVNIFLAFVQSETGSWLIILSLILIVVLYIFRAFRSLVIATRLLTFHKLHFLLYLCTVEVAPLIILTRLIYQNI